MKQLKIDQILVPISILLFNLLFWSEKMGINALLFTSIIIAVLLRKYKGAFTLPLIASIAGTLISAVMVVVNNSELSKVVLILSSFAMAGFFHRADLKFLGFSFLATLRQILSVPAHLLGNLFSQKAVGHSVSKGIVNLSKYGIVPTLIFGFFLTLYCAANDKFANLLSNYIELIFRPATSGSLFSFDQVMFFLLSVFVVGALLLKPKQDRFATAQSKFKDQMDRKRKDYRGFARFQMLDLLQEYKNGLILMIALNVLLFVVNMTDIVFVWFNFEPMSANALSKYVHEGTYILIASILCAMGVLLYFFRGNINFLGGIKPLKYAALAWIIQNVVLATSVGIRNFHYIREYGLASKRIGVLVFLLLTVIGLIFMWVKIRDRKSVFFMLDRNAWAAYGMLIFLTMFNWDGLITRYNLSMNSNNTLDAYYIIHKLSDKNLPLLIEYQASMKGSKNSYWSESGLHNKLRRFVRMQSRYTILSWNYRDWQVARYLRQHKTKIKEMGFRPYRKSSPIPVKPESISTY